MDTYVMDNVILNVLGRISKLGRDCMFFMDMNKVENDIWSIVLRRTRKIHRLEKDGLLLLEER